MDKSFVICHFCRSDQINLWQTTCHRTPPVQKFGQKSPKSPIFTHQFWHVFPETHFHPCVLYCLAKMATSNSSTFDAFLRFLSKNFNENRLVTKFSPILSEFFHFCQILSDFVRIFRKNPGKIPEIPTGPKFVKNTYFKYVFFA